MKRNAAKLAKKGDISKWGCANYQQIGIAARHKSRRVPVGTRLLFLLILNVRRCSPQHHLILNVRRRSSLHYIIPPIPGLGIAGAGLSSFLSVMTHSVVRNIPAIEAAFSSATRATFAGSTTPAANRFSYSSLRAL